MFYILLNIEWGANYTLVKQYSTTDIKTNNNFVQNCCYRKITLKNVLKFYWFIFYELFYVERLYNALKHIVHICFAITKQ